MYRASHVQRSLVEYRMYVAQSLSFLRRYYIDMGLLPYTELTKYHVQNVFHVHKARNLPYRLGSITQLLCA
jgi:hypothetical protein